MKGKKILALLFSVFSYSLSYAQLSLNPAFEIDTPAVYITTDNLDNIYAITDKNQLLKYNSSGKLVWNYSNKALGKLAYVDATDPMRILLFYPGIQQAVILNNNLNEINRYNFGSDATKLVTLIATANSNGYWIYDQLNRQLQKLGNQFNEEQVSGNIFQLTGTSGPPALLKSTDQNVFIYKPSAGILQFDRFGAYLKRIEIDSIASFQVKNDQILFLKEKDWKSVEVSNSEIKTVFSLSEKPIQASEGNKTFAILLKNKIKVYSIVRKNEEK